MGRLEHLKLSLPAMLQQGCEIIVVDFSCPEGTAAFVRRHFPSARIISVKGEKYFSNWKARNAGAAAAKSNVLVFCDADIILSQNAIALISDNFREDTFGTVWKQATLRSSKERRGLAINQLRGFQVVPAAAFRRVGGYDEVLQGYAAGGDTDLQARLTLAGLARLQLNSSLVERVLEHDDLERMRNHNDSVSVSYCAGLLYRAAKFALLQRTSRLNLPLNHRLQIYEAARAEARKLGLSADHIKITLKLLEEPILMPRALGFDAASRKISVTIEISGVGKLLDSPS